MLQDSPTREAEASGVFPSSSRQEPASLREGTWAEEVALDFSRLLPPHWLMAAQMVKHLPAMRETRVPSLGQEDSPRRRGMATHSSILARRIPWTEEPGGLQSMGLQKTRLSDFNFTFFPLNCSADSSCWAATPPTPTPRMEQRSLRGGYVSFPRSFSVAFCVSTSISVGISLSLSLSLDLSHSLHFSASLSAYPSFHSSLFLSLFFKPEREPLP